ncbi:MAG: RecX family transcriptional regulator [Bacteroidetes bacterium]|nr:RecX family transcriptional regulator [Bacteroidota bacterium]
MNNKKPEKIITPLLALEKMRSWCAYQERSQNDVRQKLFEYKLESEQVESIIINLIEEKFLNEERFAMAFAGGKFRIKHWGRIKIKIALKQHRVSDYCIKKALKSIDGEAYEQVLIKVIEKKLRLTKMSDKHKKYYTVLNYVLSRGFESDLVIEQLKVLLSSEDK